MVKSMDYNFKFPKDLYSEVRIEEHYSIWLTIRNGKVENDGESSEVGAMVRVFDGNMWFTATTNTLEEIQSQLDSLAEIATPDPDIYENEVVKEFEVNKDVIMNFDKESDLRKVPRSMWKEILDDYVEKCSYPEDKDVTFRECYISGEHEKKHLITSKGTDVAWDMQSCSFGFTYGFTVDGVTSYGNYYAVKMTLPELIGLEEKVLEKKKLYLDYAKNAKDIDPGEYECVLAPMVTAMFTHESFGHKSEADFMLTDKTLAEEWVIGKKVGSEKISICDDGQFLNHGYAPYDDEGTKACKTYLMKDGVLTGRLHDSKSAVTMGEQKTGNSRAQDYHKQPIVRMTNTYMEPGTDKLEDMIAGIKDGIYVMDVSNGTGNSTFVMNPTLCFRIRSGKVCEPVRVHMLTGNVFRTLFDVDAVGDDYELFDTYRCGKNGQVIRVSAGGPSIRVKKLSIS